MNEKIVNIILMKDNLVSSSLSFMKNFFTRISLIDTRTKFAIRKNSLKVQKSHPFSFLIHDDDNVEKNLVQNKQRTDEK